MAKQYLAGKKVEFKDINIENDQTAGMYIMHKTGQSGVPVIEIGDEVILGFDRERIDGALRHYKLVD
jgi:glutaredoxin